MCRLVQQRGQAFLSQATVLQLTSSVVGRNRQDPLVGALAEPAQHVLLQRCGEGLGCSQVEPDLGPGMGPIGVLPAGPARWSETPFQLSLRNQMIRDQHRIDSGPAFGPCVTYTDQIGSERVSARLGELEEEDFRWIPPCNHRRVSYSAPR
jgi:hypothetical protein